MDMNLTLGTPKTINSPNVFKGNMGIELGEFIFEQLQVSPICLKTASNAIQTTKGFSDTINIHASYIAVAERVFSRPHHHFKGKALEISLLPLRSKQLGKSKGLPDYNFSDIEEFQNDEQVSCCFMMTCQDFTCGV